MKIWKKHFLTIPISYKILKKCWYFLASLLLNFGLRSLHSLHLAVWCLFLDFSLIESLNWIEIWNLLVEWISIKFRPCLHNPCNPPCRLQSISSFTNFPPDGELSWSGLRLYMQHLWRKQKGLVFSGFFNFYQTKRKYYGFYDGSFMTPLEHFNQSYSENDNQHFELTRIQFEILGS